MAPRDKNNGSQKNGLSIRTTVAIVALAVAIVSATVSFFVGRADAESDLKPRVRALEQDSAVVLEKVTNIERTVDRMERKMFNGDR